MIFKVISHFKYYLVFVMLAKPVIKKLKNYE